MGRDIKYKKKTLEDKVLYIMVTGARKAFLVKDMLKEVKPTDSLRSRH